MAEGARLESVFTRKGNVGSNPTLSAITFVIYHLEVVIPRLIPQIRKGSPVNREVNVTKRVKTLQGLRYCPVVLSANGRIRPDWVLVSGREERHPEGAYYLEWREGAKRTRLSETRGPCAIPTGEYCILLLHGHGSEGGSLVYL